MNSTIIPNDFGSLTLGRFTLFPPLRVDVQELEIGEWLAHLLPGELTDFEWGTGKTPTEAVEDLASSVEGMWQFFQKTPDDKLGSNLLVYKQTLQKYALVHTTNLDWWDKGKPVKE